MPVSPKDPNKFILQGRASFPKLCKGETQESKKKDGTVETYQKYSSQLICSKDKMDHKEFLKWLRTQADLVYGGDSKDFIKLKPNYCQVKDGDTWLTKGGDKQLDKHPEYENSWVVTVASYAKPDVRNKGGQKVEQERYADDGTGFYAGCECKVCVRVVKSQYEGTRYIRIEPSSVLSMGVGEPFGKTNNADDDFADDYDDEFGGEIAATEVVAAPVDDDEEF